MAKVLKSFEQLQNLLVDQEFPGEVRNVVGTKAFVRMASRCFDPGGKPADEVVCSHENHRFAAGDKVLVVIDRPAPRPDQKPEGRIVRAVDEQEFSAILKQRSESGVEQLQADLVQISMDMRGRRAALKKRSVQLEEEFAARVREEAEVKAAEQVDELLAEERQKLQQRSQELQLERLIQQGTHENKLEERRQEDARAAEAVRVREAQLFASRRGD